MTNHKPYLYSKGSDPKLDGELSAAPAFSKVRVGDTHLFWKFGLRWYTIPFADLQRIYRRVESVFGKLCCGGKSFFIEWLVLVLHDGNELVLHIGDDVQKDAENLLLHLQDVHPEIQYGKVYN